MTELNLEQIEYVSGGIAPMLAFYAAYTALWPFVALDISHGVKVN